METGILTAHTHKGEEIFLNPAMANRHGLIAGATGTGKTVTLKRLAEGFSKLGVPVFLADVKGDLSGLSEPGKELNEKVKSRLESFGALDGWTPCEGPVRYWDVFGKGGIPVRTVASEIGPLLLSRMLGLNDTQTEVLSVIFRIADDEGMLLLDIKDLRSMCAYVGENAKDYVLTYGNIAKQTTSAIQRKLMNLEDQGGNLFLGEPALDIRDWMKKSGDRGIINILKSDELINTPVLYSTFLLWMMSELYETMPEVGDCPVPKMIFFFDEAHLLFDDAPKPLLEKIQQVIRLIRSKGVGIYFITQSPSDIPEPVLAQLGNRIQHALRAYTPKEQTAIKAAAASFRQNPEFDTKTAIGELATGEALISFLDDEGRPGIVQRGFVCPPECCMGAADDGGYKEDSDPLADKYKDTFDRDSAYEVLERRFEAAEREREEEELRKAKEKAAKQSAPKSTGGSYSRQRKSAGEKVVDSALRSIGRNVGNSLVRSFMGMLKK